MYGDPNLAQLLHFSSFCEVSISFFFTFTLSDCALSGKAFTAISKPCPQKGNFLVPHLSPFTLITGWLGSVRFNSVPFSLETCSYAPFVEVNG